MYKKRKVLQDKLKARGTHATTQGLASTSRMSTAISPGQCTRGSHGQLSRLYWGLSAWRSRRVHERANPYLKDSLLLMPEVLARPWVCVCVPLALRLSYKTRGRSCVAVLSF